MAMESGSLKPKTVQVRDFSRGMARTNSRTTIKDNQAWMLENLQPIGEGNLQVLPPKGANLTTVAAGVATMFGRNMKIAGAEVARMITMNNDGSITAVDPTSGAQTTVAVAGTVTTKARCTIWQDTILLIIDPTKGYFSWEGTTLLGPYPVNFTGNTTNTSPIVTNIPSTAGMVGGNVMGVTGTGIPVGATILSVDSATQITLSAPATATNPGVALQLGNGAPLTGSDISTFEGRTWIVSPNSRTRTFTAPLTMADFQTADAAGSGAITDSSFVGAITALLSALELLWEVGPAGVNAISNVQVAASITTFSDSNILSDVGTVWPSAIASFQRTFIFGCPYGVYAVVGSTPQQLAADILGLWPPETGSTVDRISFSTDNPAVTFILNGVFVWGLLVTYNDPVLGNRPVILCFSQNAWFLASQGATLTWITGITDPATGKKQLWGTDGTNIFQCFKGAVAGAYTLQSKLWDFGAFTTRKQLVNLALEFNNPQANLIALNLTLENESGNQAQNVTVAAGNTITFTGAGGQTITFTGSGGIAITWISAGIQQVVTLTQGFAGDDLGLKITGTSLPFAFSGVAMAIEPMGEWT